MIVASIRTATARPTPACLISSDESVPNSEKTATMTSAALVTTPAVLGSRSARPRRWRSRVDRLTDTAEDEDVVVHREAEEHHEEEHREPRR